MEWMRSWLLSITCAAVIATLAVALTPDGFPRRVTKFAGGLLLLLAALGPVKKLDGAGLSDALAKYQAQYSGYTETFAQENTQAAKAIIARETAAYISDKAAALGLADCRVEVSCRLTEEGFPAPETVRVTGSGPPEAWEALSRAITADFAIEASAQTLERTDAP